MAKVLLPGLRCTWFAVYEDHVQPTGKRLTYPFDNISIILADYCCSDVYQHMERKGMDMESQLLTDIGKHTQGETILLVGSSGNIGGKALELLVNHGKAAAITAFDKKEPRMKSLPPEVKVLHGAQADITDPEAVARATEGASIVVCAVGVPRFTAPGEKKLTPYELEQTGVHHIVSAAKKEGVKQIIYISALGVARGENIPPFHHAHLAKKNAEQCIIETGIPYTILRPSGYFFDFRDLLAAAIAGRYHVVNKGASKVQPLHQNDVAAILTASINHKKVFNKIIPLGGPEIFSYMELGQLFGRILKQKVNVIQLAPEKYKKEYFNSDVILFRASSDSVLTKKELDNLYSLYPGLVMVTLEDYLNNPEDPMLKTFFKKS
jgi:uncharacterized protein YbjT (DUF2867 family)